jgi:hypothetical protein
MQALRLARTSMSVLMDSSTMVMVTQARTRTSMSVPMDAVVHASPTRPMQVLMRTAVPVLTKTPMSVLIVGMVQNVGNTDDVDTDEGADVGEGVGCCTCARVADGDNAGTDKDVGVSADEDADVSADEGDAGTDKDADGSADD